MDYLLIIDGSSLLSTQFYGNLPREVLAAKTPEEKEKNYYRIMKTSKGVYTNGIYGFLRTLFSIIERQKPAHIAITWDLTRGTFRRELYEDYKANRSETMEPLAMQFELCQKVLSRMGFAQFMDTNYEADDYSGSLARKFSPECEIVIMTKDRDYLQLVNDRVKLWMVVNDQKKADEYFKKYGLDRSRLNVPDKTIWLDREHVQKEYGILPESVPSLKGLMGDASDNIKGVPGVGEKTATALIAHYGTIDALYDAIRSCDDEKALASYWKRELGISRSPYFNLTKESDIELVGEKAARLSLKLATIVTEIEIDKELDDLKPIPDHREAVRVLDELEITSIKLPESDSAEEDKDLFVSEFEEKLVEINDLTAFTELRDRIAAESVGKTIGISLEKNDGEISALAIANDKAVYSIRTEGFIYPDLLSELLVDLANNAAFICSPDYKALLHECGELDNDYFDLSIAHYLIDPLSQQHGAIAVCSLFDIIPPDKGDSNAFEAYTALNMKDELINRLAKEEQQRVYEEIEKPLIPVLYRMEREGIICDPAILAKQGEELDKAIKELEVRIYELAGEKFNILSPKQLGIILFEKLGIKGAKKTRSGYSTAADVLEKLSGQYEIVDKVLKYRTVSKLKSTYTEGLAQNIQEDGRIHCTFNQTVAATGRLSCTDPNLQNIPVREEIGRQIRKAFVPKEGCVFVDADYSQIELRIMAHMAADEKLLDDYKNARDIHRATAAAVFNVPYDEVTKKQRGEAKAVNFGIIYGISSFGLGQDLDISRSQASEYINSYFEQYPQVKAYLDKLIEDASTKGYSSTMFGRRRPVPELSSSNFMQRNFGERVAMNMPIQGTAADIMKVAMVKVDKALREGGFKSKMLLQIHDEILIEAPFDEAEAVKELLQKEMSNAVRLLVELEVEAVAAKSWFDLK